MQREKIAADPTPQPTCADTTTPTFAAVTPTTPRHDTRTHDGKRVYPPGSPRGCLYDIRVTKPLRRGPRLGSLPLFSVSLPPLHDQRFVVSLPFSHHVTPPTHNLHVTSEGLSTGPGLPL